MLLALNCGSPSRREKRESQKVWCTRSCGTRACCRSRSGCQSKQFSSPTLFLLGRDEFDDIKCVCLKVPDRSSEIAMLDAATGRAAGTARYSANIFRGEL